ncbi:MAG: hypothetical protein AB4426_15865 [Xenococcaceae cyanobacterium]
MNVWLVIANPYAYDRAMGRAILEAQQCQTGLQVVFFISVDSVGEMMHELGEIGWLGSASLRTLQTSMLEGYRALADDVLKRVQRKAAQVELIVEGVVEKPSLEQYIHRILAQGAMKVIIAGSKSLIPKLEMLPETVEYIEEE